MFAGLGKIISITNIAGATVSRVNVTSKYQKIDVRTSAKRMYFISAKKEDGECY